MGKKYVVSATGLNLREGPSTSDEIIVTLRHGHDAERLSGADGDEWWKVRAQFSLSPVEGFVASRFLTPAAPPATMIAPGAGVGVTLAQLRALAPNAKASLIEPMSEVIDTVLDQRAISANNLRVSHFLAQAAHESGGFRRVVESLNYSADRLQVVWPSRFPTDTVAEAHARNPEKLANFVYADRLGNGPTSSGDGWRFRGRGIFQLTGRANYRRIGAMVDMDLENAPETAADPQGALRIAAAFWSASKLNDLADRNRLTEITRKINGGLNGLEDRRHYLNRARGIWG